MAFILTKMPPGAFSFHKHSLSGFIISGMLAINNERWSFGIVLWEIVTLGGSPYPGIPNEDLFNLLMDGYRMEKPENCSQELYKLMLATWHPQPTCRPNFTELRQKLESMLELTKSYINLSVSVSQDYYQNDTSSIPEDSIEDEEGVAHVEPHSPTEILPPMEDTNSQRHNVTVEVDYHLDTDQPSLTECSIDTSCKMCISPVSRSRGNYNYLPVSGTSDDINLSSALIPDSSHRLDRDSIVSHQDFRNYNEHNTT